MEALFKLLNQLLSPLDGYKTKIAAILAAAVALNRAWGFVPPNIEASVLEIAIALGFYGIAHKFDKWQVGLGVATPASEEKKS